MAHLGRTLFRFTGAMLLAAGATAVDNPQTLYTPTIRPGATVPVLVASRDIPEGVTIDREALVIAQWPAGTQPAGAYTTANSVANRVTRVAVYKGEPIVPGRLAPEGRGPGLEVKITPGKRAYSIRVYDDATLAGMIQPNARVDLMAIGRDFSRGGRPTARLFMSNMRVLAIGTGAQRMEDGRPVRPRVAIIEVTPEEGERLASAAGYEPIHLVLRGFADDPVASRADSVTLRVDRSGLRPR